MLITDKRHYENGDLLVMPACQPCCHNWRGGALLPGLGKEFPLTREKITILKEKFTPTVLLYIPTNCFRYF